MYYSDDGHTFSSKIKAIEHQEKTGAQFHFYYYDELYEKLNWKIEPPLSLQDYYKEQALRLREKYDYLILCYSGGLDSTNILETFHKNNIKLDKIIIVGAFSQDSNSSSDENMNIEAYTSAFPYIEKLGLSSITEKIDYTKYFNDIDSLSITKYGSEWIDNIGSWFSPHHFFWKDIEKLVVPFHMRNKKSALIFGKEKPYLMHENGKMGFRFRDVALTNYGSMFGNEYCDRVYFYWDHEYPLILLKQLHTLKSIVEKYSSTKNVDIGNSINEVVKVVNTARKSPNGGMKNIIYSIDHTIDKKSPKNKSRIISSRDSYLVRAKTSEVFAFYKSGITNMKSRIRDVNNQKIVTSKFYEL